MTTVAMPLIETRHIDSVTPSNPCLLWPVAPSGELRIADNDVHVWAVHLDRHASLIRELAGVLTDDERERASRFRYGVDRHRYVVAHAELRRVLTRYVGVPAHDLRFRRNRFGKPSLAHRSDVTFNIAHAESVALIAVTTGRQVGIDVERATVHDDAFDVAEICFSPAERRALRAVPRSQVSDAFTNGWTRKEALIKAIGTGLGAPLGAFEVSLEPGTPARVRRVSGSVRAASWWTMESLHPAAGYIGALAVRRSSIRLMTWQMGAQRLSGQQW